MFSTFALRHLGQHSLEFYGPVGGRTFASAAAAKKEEIPSNLNKESKGQEKKAPLQKSSSFCMNLFLGKSALDQVFPYPLDLSPDRREMLQMIIAPTNKFLEEINDPFKNDEQAAIPREVLAKFAELGAFGAVVPEEYGGAGLNNTQLAMLAERVGAHDLGLGVTMGAHQSIGYKGILLFGTPAQKEKYLPELAAGTKFACFCLTEPTSGSDANSIQSRAVKSDCGKYYILNGGKIWISNGGLADVFTVFARTPIKKPDGTVKEEVSAFIVERQFPGLSTGPPEKKLGIKGSNTTSVFFDNCKVPVENLLGQEGEGFKIAMNILNNGRFSIPAASTGSMKYCIQKTIDHVNQRVQFGKKLKDFGRIQEILSDMIVRHYVAESITYSLASNMDRGVMEYQLEAAIGKIVGSENAWQVCDDAIQIHGGMGYMKECGLERVLRDLRIFRIFEGANDILRLFVALTGMQFAGKQLQQLAMDIKSGNMSTLFGEFKRRTFGESLGNSQIGGLVQPSLKVHASELNSAIVKFGRTVEQLLRQHKRGIVDRQYELYRIANAAIDIYSVGIVLSRCNYALEKSGQAASADQQIADLFCRQAKRRINANLDEALAPSPSQMGLIGQIAREVCENGEMAQKHPIDL